MIRTASTLALLVLVLVAVAYLGVEHRDNCTARGRVSCSVLPWNEGQQPSLSAEQKRLLQER